jgi:hypothetical protein
MKHRVLVSFGALAVAAGVVALAAATVAGQTRTNGVPRTADGKPDLSGVWSHNSATPFERPKELEGRATLTDTEMANLRKNAAELFNGDTDAAFGDAVFLAALKSQKEYQSSDGASADTPKGTGNYNHFWLVDRVFNDNRTSLVVDPPDGRLPAQTEEARKRAAEIAEYNRVHYADGPESVPHNCYGGGLPMFGAGYNNYYQIVQSPDTVGIHMEMMHDARMVPITSQPEIPATIRQRLGFSRGHWEGDTLVVVTTNFTGNSRGGGGRGSSPTSHLTEKFTRMSAETLKYEVTVNDPGTYTKPWTAVLYWKAEKKDQIYEFACHEGNEGMAGALSGIRALEKTDAEAAKRGSR